MSLKSQEDEDEDFGMDDLSLDDDTRAEKTEAGPSYTRIILIIIVIILII